MIGLGLSVYKSKISSTGGGGGSSYTPPLDAYPATAAYSVRKLSSTYSGDALRVRRTVSPFDEQDIGFDSNGYLDTAAIVAFGGSDSLGVSIWYDQTGNGHHATQTSTNDQPLIYNGVDVETIGGLVSLTDNGVNGSIAMSIPSFGTSSSTASLFSLVTPRADRCQVWNAQGGYGASESNGALSIYQGLFVAGTLIKPIEQRLQSYLFGATDYGYVNGILGVSGNAGSDALGNNSNMSIGGQAVNFREVAAMQEIMIYLNDQTSARPTIESNLNSYYQVTNLPDYTSGFLADYSGAAAAYSVRQLSNTAIKCMRVRRAVAPFDEKDIGFTAGGDLDEAAIVAFGGSDELRVSAWYDQSGQQKHATQSTAASQPQIYNGTAVITENGKPCIDFDVTSLTGGLTMNNFINTANDYSIECVFRYDQNDGMLFNFTDTTNVLGATVGKDLGTLAVLTLTPSGRDDVSGSATLGDQILSFSTHEFSTPTTTLDINASSASGSNTSRGHFRDSRLGVGPVTGTHLNGVIQEIVIWPADQSSNRTAIETNTNLYYGVYTMYNYEPATSGFLFDYPDAEAAYSVRQLNNNATVSMRVRRTVSPFDEQDIGFDGSGNLDEAAISTFGGSDPLTVSVWYDQSGQQKHATQITAGNQPQIYNGTSVITNPDNSLPVLDCTVATGAGFSSVPISINGTMTYSMVSFFDASEGGGYTSNGSFKVGISNSTGNVTLVGGGNTAVTDSNLINDGSVHHMVRTTSSAGTLVVNTANVQSSSNTASGTSSWSINNYLGNRRTTDNVAHELQEFIVWPSDQLITNQSGIETNINSYFQIYP